MRKPKVIRVLSDPSMTNREIDQQPSIHEEGNFIFSPWPRTYSLSSRCYFTCWSTFRLASLNVYVILIGRSARGSRGEVGSGCPAKTSATKYNVTGEYNHDHVLTSILRKSALRENRLLVRRTTHILKLVNYTLRNRLPYERQSMNIRIKEPRLFMRVEIEETYTKPITITADCIQDSCTTFIFL